MTNFILESSLSRIQRKLDKHAAGSITGWRADSTYRENVAKNKEILAYLLNAGYSVTKVKGSYIENFGSEDQTEVGESSFFVVNQTVDGDDKGELERDLIRLGKAFDQDSVLSIPFSENAVLIGTSHRENAWPDYGQRENVGKPNFGDPEGQFFSRVKGRKFAFENDISFPQTINGIRGLKILAERVSKKLPD